MRGRVVPGVGTLHGCGTLRGDFIDVRRKRDDGEVRAGHGAGGSEAAKHASRETAAGRPLRPLRHSTSRGCEGLDTARAACGVPHSVGYYIIEHGLQSHTFAQDEKIITRSVTLSTFSNRSKKKQQN